MVRASLPAANYERPASLIFRGADLYVRFHPEDGDTHKDFAFTRLGLAPPITEALAVGFAQATGPGGSRRTLESARSLYSGARAFAACLLESAHPPRTVEELGAGHVAPFRLKRSRHGNSQLQSIRTLFRGSDLPAAFREALFAPHSPAMRPSVGTSAYSEFEFRQIQRAARTEVRRALARIRDGERTLAAIDADGPPATLKGQMLVQVARTGDIPRPAGSQRTSLTADQRVALEQLRSIFPTFSEVTAVTVLLICMTGQNLTTVCGLRATHSRADDQLTEPPVALVRASKPRRGRYNAEMDLAFTSDGRVEAGDDYASAAGVFRIALEMCRRARSVAGSDRLLVALSTVPTEHQRGGAKVRPLPHRAILPAWRATSPNGTPILGVDARRLRLTYLQIHQRPVAHSPSTLANQYLARDRNARHEYQRVVVRALEDEVTRLRAASEVQTLSAADLELAAKAPEALAKRLNISVTRLEMLLDGRLDTVATACSDHLASPYTPVGHPCTASFLLCLGCPNARSEPRHVPVQAVVLEAIHARRASMDEAEWNTRFADASARLHDLLERQQADVASSASRATEEQRRVAELLVDGRLELR